MVNPDNYKKSVAWVWDALLDKNMSLADIQPAHPGAKYLEAIKRFRDHTKKIKRKADGNAWMSLARDQAAFTKQQEKSPPVKAGSSRSCPAQVLVPAVVIHNSEEQASAAPPFAVSKITKKAKPVK